MGGKLIEPKQNEETGNALPHTSLYQYGAKKGAEDPLGAWIKKAPEHARAFQNVSKYLERKPFRLRK